MLRQANLMVILGLAVATVPFAGGEMRMEVGGHDSGLHKDLIPVDATDLYALLLGAVMLIVASAGGLGGGGLLVPLYFFVLGFDTKHAIALSTVTVLGGAIANVTVASLRRHPHADRPLIDWDLVLMLEPLAVLGSLVGSFVSRMIPAVIVVGLLVAVLTFLAVRTFIKAVRLMREEGGLFSLFSVGRTPLQHKLSWKEAKRAKLADREEEARERARSLSELRRERRASKAGRKAPGPPGVDERTGLIAHTHAGCGGSYHSVAQPEGLPQLQNEETIHHLVDGERRTAWWKPLMMLVIFSGVAALGIARDSLPCPSLGFWVLAAAPFFWVISFFVFIRKHTLAEHELKVSVGYTFAPGDVIWTPQDCVRWPLVMAAGGFLAGAFGIGGGLVKSPLLLEMGVCPFVASATVATLILFTSATATTAFMAFGSLPLDYGLLMFAFGFVVTLIGGSGISRWLIRHKYQSPSVLSVAVIIACSCMAMTYHAAMHLKANRADALKWGSFCAEIPFFGG